MKKIGRVVFLIGLVALVFILGLIDLGLNIFPGLETLSEIVLEFIQGIITIILAVMAGLTGGGD